MAQRSARLALACALLAGCRAEARSSPPPAAEPASDVALVRTEPVRALDDARPIHLPARLEVEGETQLSFRIGGVVGRGLVDEGQHVRRGQKLAALEVSELRIAVSQASAALTKAERDQQRLRALAATQSASERDVGDAITARDLAEGQLALAKLNLEHAIMIAPFDARVVERWVEPGELIAPNAPAYSLQPTAAALRVVAGLSDRDAARVVRGDVAEVSIGATGARLRGSVESIALEPSVATGAYEVRIHLPDGTQPGLRAGMPAKLTITPAQKKSVRVLPPAALVSAQGTRGSVFAVEGDRARRVEVTLGGVLESGIELIDSERALDEVITDGRAWLEDGERVRVLAAELHAPLPGNSAP